MVRLNKKTAREEMEVYYPQEVALGMPCRARRGEVKAGRVQAERQEPGPQVFPGLVGTMLWGFMAKTGELQFRPKEQGFHKLLEGSYLRGIEKECHGIGDTHHNCHWGSHREFIFTCDSVGCSPGCTLA